MPEYKTDFVAARASFHLPDGVIYLDGNSLGPLPVAAVARATAMMQEEWGQLLIGGWNKAGWMEQPRRIGDRIARLIGAEAGSVVVGDTLSIKVFQALSAALALQPRRRLILSDSGNFPSDLYMAQGLVQLLGSRGDLKIVEPEMVGTALDTGVAVLMLTEVDYRSGRLHDMKRLTARAKSLGIITVWDLAHSAGALPVDVAGCGVDFAVGCTYKYLNGGPGAPAFIYVAPHLADLAEPVLAGWLGHAAPFAFERDYRPGPGIERMRVGTPPVLAMAVLEAALDVWDRVDLVDVRRKSIELTNLFIAEVERTCPEMTLASPRRAAERGSHVAFRHPQAHAVMQALIARGVIGDFRAPDNLRFGFAPLYLDVADVTRAAAILAEILAGRSWDRPEYHIRAAVT